MAPLSCLKWQTRVIARMGETVKRSPDSVRVKKELIYRIKFAIIEEVSPSLPLDIME